MQNSSEFQYIAIDTIHESATNPRRTFDEARNCRSLPSLSAPTDSSSPSPFVPTPKASRSLPVQDASELHRLQKCFPYPLASSNINDTRDNSSGSWSRTAQRVDVHPYEEAQGFQRLLDMPGYDVAALVEKSGKSASHIYARLSLLQLIPSIAEAFSAERITASHANLLARLPQDTQAEAFEQCWRKDWQDKSHTCSPPSTSRAWIQSNLYL